MPAPSRSMRQAAAIAEHHPEKLYARNRGMLKMSKSQLHDYAATKGLKNNDSRMKKSMKAVMRMGRKHRR